MGQKETTAAIFGGGVDGDGEDGGGSGARGGGGVLGLGAKKRDITCCFCLPVISIRRRNDGFRALFPFAGTAVLVGGEGDETRIAGPLARRKSV